MINWELSKKEKRSPQIMHTFQVAVQISSLLVATLILSCSVVDSSPLITSRHSEIKRHVVQKRATAAEILGDLTAGSAGILNEDRKYIHLLLCGPWRRVGAAGGGVSNY